MRDVELAAADPRRRRKTSAFDTWWDTEVLLLAK
jgi:hypothetical protein